MNAIKYKEKPSFFGNHIRLSWPPLIVNSEQNGR